MRKIIAFIFAFTFIVTNSYSDITFWTTEVQPARMEKQMDMAKSFEAKTGKELWGFVPPLIAPNLPNIMNTSLNLSKGGTNALFGVDGSLVVHDMYFKSPLKNSKQWHTILFVPYGRGGAGFSVLDITDPEKPEHLYSIYNDIINNRVYRMDHTQNILTYPYFFLLLIP